MPISFEIEQTIRYPADKTFSFLSDLSNMPLWNYYIQSVTKISEGPVGIGSIFEQKRPHDLHFLKIVEFIPLEKITVALQPPGPAHQSSFVLTNMGEQTKVVYKWIVYLEQYKWMNYIPSEKIKQWLLSFAERHIFTKIRSAVAQNFFKLKTLLENGSVLLQDGRLINLPE